MSSPLKFLVLAQYFPPDMGGASARAANVVKGLSTKGCEVKVVAAFPHYPLGNVPKGYRRKALAIEEFRYAKVTRVWIPALSHSNILNRAILHMCFVVSSLFALPFVGDFDVIWAANPNLFCFYSALIYGFTKRKPIIRNVDDLWPEVFFELRIVRSRFAKRFLDFLAKLSYIVPSAITPISDGYKRRIIEEYHIIPEKIHVIEVGVDSVNPRPSDNNEKGQFVVMYSGVLGVGYDFETVLKTAGFLSQYDDLVFLIRGVGELAPTLEQMIRESQLKNVVLYTDFLPKKKLSALLRRADVFLLPMSSAVSVNDGIPAKVFEYQAYGKPIICASGGEPSRYVKAIGCGLAVKPGDAYGLARAVVKLYRNRKLASDLGRKGLKHVSENFTAERIGERMYEVITSVRDKQRRAQ
jgi:colanic acid biosynthesis glycosyl transferase WcaI